MLLDIFMESVMHVFQDSMINGKFKRTAIIWNKNMLYIIHVYSVYFEQFDAFSLIFFIY